MTTINQLKKVLFDQKDKLVDPNYDKIVFIVQDETSAVPGRTVPGSSDPVFPVRRLTLPQLMSYIDSQTGTDLPVLCLESSGTTWDSTSNSLKFLFGNLSPSLSYDDIVCCRVIAAGPAGTFTAVFTWNNNHAAAAEPPYDVWFLDVNVQAPSFDPVGLISYSSGTGIEVECLNTGLTEASGWKAYMWVYKKATL